MGKNTPPEFPTIEDNKYYICEVQAYMGVRGDCDDPYYASERCCIIGSSIKEWQEYGMDCQEYTEMCTVTGVSSQRLHNVVGPFDDIYDCWDAL